MTEQLVEALEAHLDGPWTVPGGAMKCGECRAYIKDGHQADCSWLLIDRYRADPEALLRENGEAVRRQGNELMVKRDRRTVSFPDLRSPKTGGAT